ncbi:L-seryl-tRNA(Sec) kinase [Periplaneta americana]|uniref:L-seryl-tRNA(Sec) kinase n=1 Tax=Periplaneta americana TaxID=6978 RepID=UPI0037E8CA3F
MRVALCGQARECQQQGDGDLHGGAAADSEEAGGGDRGPARGSGPGPGPGAGAVTCLVVLIGLPGSGKTTLCQALSRCLGAQALPLSYDSLLPAATDAWREARLSALAAVEAAARQGPRFVLVDDNMYYRSMRWQCYQLARRLRLGFCQLYLHCELEDALRRNAGRRDAVPREVVTRMAERLEPPAGARHPWERASLVVDAAATDLQQVLRFLEAAAACPVPALEEPAEPSTPLPGPLHCADVALRKLVGQRIRQAGPTHTAALIAARRRILEDIRAGHIPLPEGDSVCLQDFLQNFLP